MSNTLLKPLKIGRKLHEIKSFKLGTLSGREDMTEKEATDRWNKFESLTSALSQVFILQAI